MFDLVELSRLLLSRRGVLGMFVITVSDGLKKSQILEVTCNFHVLYNSFVQKLLSKS